MKPIRKAVRTFLIKENKVLVIQYITDNQYGYYDIPGGKIEHGENAEQASIREFKEETGIAIYNPKYAGNLIVEYPDRVFDFDVFITSVYDGELHETSENTSEWMDIDELLKKDKKFPNIYLLDNQHQYDLLNTTNFQWHFIADKYHNKTDEIYYEKSDEFWREYL